MCANNQFTHNARCRTMTHACTHDERIEVMADFNAFLVEGLLLLSSKNYFHLDERCRSIWTLVHILWRMTFDDTAFHCPKRSLIELGKRGFILSVNLLINMALTCCSLFFFGLMLIARVISAIHGFRVFSETQPPQNSLFISTWICSTLTVQLSLLLVSVLHFILMRLPRPGMS